MADDARRPPARRRTPAVSRRLTRADTPAPRTHLLSNGHYTVMVTNAGGGFSTCRGLAVTRWRNDPTRDDRRAVPLRPGRRDRAGVVGRRTSRSARRPRATRSSSPPTRPSSAGGTAAIETHLEVAVAPDQDVEVRRLTLANHDARAADARGDELRRGRAERPAGRPGPPGVRQAVPGNRVAAAVGRPALPPPAAARPTSRRCGPSTSSPPTAADAGAAEYETDRAKFLGRRRSPGRPRGARPGRCPAPSARSSTRCSPCGGR